jgi:hypothetical protein
MMSRLNQGASVLALVATLGLVGCSGGDDEGGAGAFVGMWQYTAGTDNTQCPMVGVNSTTQLQGSKETFSRGVGAALINSDPNSNCILNFNIMGTVATAIPGQSCMTSVATDSGPIPTTINVVSAVFAVTGATARYSNSANFSLNINGSQVNCSITSSGDLVRISM